MNIFHIILKTSSEQSEVHFRTRSHLFLLSSKAIGW